jgi:hypothetical protein
MYDTCRKSNLGCSYEWFIYLALGSVDGLGSLNGSLAHFLPLAVCVACVDC